MVRVKNVSELQVNRSGKIISENSIASDYQSLWVAVAVRQLPADSIIFAMIAASSPEATVFPIKPNCVDLVTRGSRPLVRTHANTHFIPYCLIRPIENKAWFNLLIYFTKSTGSPTSGNQSIRSYLESICKISWNPLLFLPSLLAYFLWLALMRGIFQGSPSQVFVFW